jgi:hypothetical protein
MALRLVSGFAPACTPLAQTSDAVRLTSTGGSERSIWASPQAKSFLDALSSLSDDPS